MYTLVQITITEQNTVY